MIDQSPKIKSIISKIFFILNLLVIARILFKDQMEPLRILLEPHPPVRNFELNELVIAPEVVGAQSQSLVSSFPLLADWHPKETFQVQFNLIEGESFQEVEQTIDRFETQGSAIRAFSSGDDRNLMEPYMDLNYQSSIAQDSYFGCLQSNGYFNFCEWWGVYDEFVIRFYFAMNDGKLPKNDIENIVKAVDQTMNIYLNLGNPGTIDH